MSTVLRGFATSLKSSAARAGARGLLIGAAALVTANSAVAADPSTEPLVQAANVTYLGGFALPPGIFGSSSFDYGGHALATYHDPNTGKFTLFLEGNNQRPGNIAQVEIPSSFVLSGNWSALPVANVIQNFSDITGGRLSSVDPTNSGNPIFVYGLLPYNGRMIVSASSSYSSSQQVSHGVSSLTVAAGGSSFKGWYSMGGGAPPRAVGGPMALVPTEWQSALGGTALTSLFGVSIVSTTSAGPTATVVNPDNVGTGGTIPGTDVLYYPLSNPVCGSFGCEATTNPTYNLASGYAGLAFIPGTRSVLFVGVHGTGTYCYGTALACNDPYMTDVKGPHAPPYQYRIWAYDANDLVAVKNGSKATYAPKPYAIIPLLGMPNSSDAFTGGATYDGQTGELFITQNYGSQARVEVWKINVGGGTTSTGGGTGSTQPATPDPPTSVTVQ